MNKSFGRFLSYEYLMTISTGTKYEKFYLIFSCLLILAAIGYRVFLVIRGNRPEIYKSFDRFIFWGYVSAGITGLFIYFSRTQGLPLFSTRLISYLWITGTIVYTGYLGWYYKVKTQNKLQDFLEQKRKAKYLKK